MVLSYMQDQGSLSMTANTFDISLAKSSLSLRTVCLAIHTVVG